MNNIPCVKLGIVSVSRDCFPISLSERRRRDVVSACQTAGIEIFEAPTCVENERDSVKALAEVQEAGVNALIVFLGNFGPESSETILAQRFQGPVMFVAAAEETGEDLYDGRGDAYCGMLNCSYNLALRGVRAYIPEYPVGTATDIVSMIQDFIPVARAVIGLSKLKVFSFGPRPQDFMACNAPIQPLFDLGVEIQENSELDLLVAYRQHEKDPRIEGIAKEMAEEIGSQNPYAGILPKLAQYEITLMDWAEANRGSREYFVVANKCWPAFQTEFGFVPCYVNSRLAAKGYPVSCEVDIFGAVSEYIGVCIANDAVTLLDINNSVPKDMYDADIAGKYAYTLQDVFMGFHCGNTPVCKLKKANMSYQRIMKRSLEPDSEPNITRGTMEGDLVDGEITFYRLQGNARGKLTAYVAQGEVLPVATRSFGGIGIFAIQEMGRFYRHVLIEKNYPHHGAVVFGHYGKAIYSVLRYLGVEDISFNQPSGMLYKTENPFA